MTSYDNVQACLAQLIGFDTTSRGSNLDLIDWAEAQLQPLGAVCRRTFNSDSSKANLWARIGPDVPGGLILSGHTDVVPVDGQDWRTDPFELTEKSGKLYGRGTSDMKSFLALCMAFAERFATADLKRPVHIAFSYDEEVGCLGAPGMIEDIVRAGAAPRAVWVGEPTLWKVVSGHKGIIVTEVQVRGHEAHSSLPERGVSAIGEAVKLMALLQRTADDLMTSSTQNAPFDPPYPSLTIGEVAGGTASNILARDCRFVFDLRCPPGHDPDHILKPFLEAAARADQQIKLRAPMGGIKITRHTDVPPLALETGNPAEVLARGLTGDNVERAVGYATEAGQFRQAGLPAVVCGPGSIDIAHQPNEFIDISQLHQGAEIFSNLVDRLAAER